MNRLMGYKKQNQRMRMRTYKRVPLQLVRKPGRPHKYSAEVDAALAFVWESYNCPCAERLRPEVTEAIRIFMRDREWHFSNKTAKMLEEMSLSTMKRRLAKFAHERGLMRGFSTTRSSELLKEIEIFHGDWNLNR